MKETNLRLITLNQEVTEAIARLGTSYQPVGDVIKKKVVATGSTGCVHASDMSLKERKEY